MQSRLKFSLGESILRGEIPSVFVLLGILGTRLLDVSVTVMVFKEVGSGDSETSIVIVTSVDFFEVSLML